MLGSWMLTSGDLSWWSKQVALLEILESNLFFFSGSEISAKCQKCAWGYELVTLIQDCLVFGLFQMMEFGLATCGDSPL